MVRHEDIWRAVDRLAAKSGMSPSGLARRAGLDPTTFNKSKRVTKEGKQRWPSTESVAKILEATDASLAEFVALIGEENTGALAQRIPTISHSQAYSMSFFDAAGHPTGNGWDEVLSPHIADPNAFGLEIDGDAMEPVFRDGAIVIVSPAASIRRGDRIVVRTKTDEFMISQLIRRSALKVELRPVNCTGEDRSLEAEDVAWIWRIVWASQ